MASNGQAVVEHRGMVKGHFEYVSRSDVLSLNPGYYCVFKIQIKAAGLPIGAFEGDDEGQILTTV